MEELQDIILKNNIVEFKIEEFTRDRTLKIVGSFDLGYYHEIEITFSGVSYISCPTSFSYATFKLASENDYNTLAISPLHFKDKVVISIIFNEKIKIGDAENYFVISDDIQYNQGMVYYYKRENLKDGETIAKWVK